LQLRSRRASMLGMTLPDVESIVATVTNGGLFLAAVFMLRYAAHHHAEESGKRVILWISRYIGYFVVGSGIGILVSAYL